MKSIKTFVRGQRGIQRVPFEESGRGNDAWRKALAQIISDPSFKKTRKLVLKMLTMSR